MLNISIYQKYTLSLQHKSKTTTMENQNLELSNGIFERGRLIATDKINFINFIFNNEIKKIEDTLQREFSYFEKMYYSQFENYHNDIVEKIYYNYSDNYNEGTIIEEKKGIIILCCLYNYSRFEFKINTIHYNEMINISNNRSLKLEEEYKDYEDRLHDIKVILNHKEWDTYESLDEEGKKLIDEESDLIIKSIENQEERKCEYDMISTCNRQYKSFKTDNKDNDIDFSNSLIFCIIGLGLMLFISILLIKLF